jgi:hypothetical protein
VTGQTFYSVFLLLSLFFGFFFYFCCRPWVVVAIVGNTQGSKRQGSWRTAPQSIPRLVPPLSLELRASVVLRVLEVVDLSVSSWMVCGSLVQNKSRYEVLWSWESGKAERPGRSESATATELPASNL